MHVVWGDYAFSLATAFIFTLAFESPIIVIEKSVFGRVGKFEKLGLAILQ